MMKSNYLLKLSLCLFFTGQVSAAESQWGIGIGAMADQQGYVDVDTKTNVIPIISYESENFRINGPQLEYKLAEYKISELGTVNFSALGKYRFDGYEADDGDIFIGMDERSGAFELGFLVDYQSKLGNLSFEFSSDVTNEHEGFESSLTFSKPYFFNSVVLEPYARVSYFSDDLVNYYYGVKSSEATTNRLEYNAESTINGEIGLRMRWQAGKHHQFISSLSYKSFGSEIKDSPLIEESGGANLILGYIYVF